MSPYRSIWLIYSIPDTEKYDPYLPPSHELIPNFCWLHKMACRIHPPQYFTNCCLFCYVSTWYHRGQLQFSTVRPSLPYKYLLAWNFLPFQCSHHNHLIRTLPQIPQKVIIIIHHLSTPIWSAQNNVIIRCVPSSILIYVHPPRCLLWGSYIFEVPSTTLHKHQFFQILNSN